MVTQANMSSNTWRHEYKLAFEKKPYQQLYFSLELLPLSASS